MNALEGMAISQDFDSRIDTSGVFANPVQLAVVLPTYNERDNIGELIQRLSFALAPIYWELIFVDDDSTDGTSEEIERYARCDRRIRIVHRIGRRGLSSACIEGCLATTAEYVAIMDADLQHDESILLKMYFELQRNSLDIVVGTRNAAGGSMGEFSSNRVLLSRAGRIISKLISHCEISDPMSGYFMFTRSFFQTVVHRMNGGGFKILLDMLASSSEPVKVREVGYRFGLRVKGESKLDVSIGAEYLYLVVDKLTGGRVQPELTVFILVGFIGMLTHFACLFILRSATHWTFHTSQFIATYFAMAGNFFLNNRVTFRARRLLGLRLIEGFLQYLAVCSFGAWANATLAQTLVSGGLHWLLAALIGIGLSSVWNYSMASLFTWKKNLPANAIGDLRLLVASEHAA